MLDIRFYYFKRIPAHITAQKWHQLSAVTWDIRCVCTVRCTCTSDTTLLRVCPPCRVYRAVSWFTVLIRGSQTGWTGSALRGTLWNGQAGTEAIFSHGGGIQ